MKTSDKAFINYLRWRILLALRERRRLMHCHKLGYKYSLDPIDREIETLKQTAKQHIQLLRNTP